MKSSLIVESIPFRKCVQCGNYIPHRETRKIGYNQSSHKESCQYYHIKEVIEPFKPKTITKIVYTSKPKILRQLIYKNNPKTIYRDKIINKIKSIVRIKIVNRRIIRASKKTCLKCDICFPSKISLNQHRSSVHAY